MIRSRSYQHNIPNYNIDEIYKLHNPDLYNRFRRRRDEIRHELGFDPNEKMLYHGSSAAEQIAANGFDLSLASAGGMLGRGIYFANRSSKASQHAYVEIEFN